MKNNNQAIYYAIFIIFTIIIWIGADIYHIAVTSTIPENMSQIIVPFDPKLDLTVINNIKTNKNPEDFSVSAPSASQAASIIPTIPEETETPTISTNSGELP